LGIDFAQPLHPLMVGRDGGKAKPLKKPKPTSKELTEVFCL